MPGSAPLILVADDDPVDLQACRRTLSKAGYRVATIADGMLKVVRARALSNHFQLATGHRLERRSA